MQLLPAVALLEKSELEIKSRILSPPKCMHGLPKILFSPLLYQCRLLQKKQLSNIVSPFWLKLIEVPE